MTRTLPLVRSTATFHLVTGEYPPQLGGVGDYTATLASALARRGCAVHVWAPIGTPGPACDGVTVHALPDAFGNRTRHELEQALARLPGRLVLQYVPNALGRRGANLAFCRWLARMRRRGFDVRVMFHEPYFYLTPAHPLRSLLAITQRVMAAVLLRASPVAYLSTESWIPYLRPYAPAGTSWVTLPIAATIRSEPAPGFSSHWRDAAGGANALVGHFGTYGDHVARDLEPALDRLLAADRRVRCLLVGRGSDGFAAAFAAAHPRDAGRVVASGAVPADEVAAALRACDVLMQPYPDGVTTRRTSVMAGLAAGVATVTTAGRLTERVWRETDAAVLVPASAASPMRDAVIALLSDDAMRRAQAQKGKQTYDERFGIERAVDALLGA